MDHPVVVLAAQRAAAAGLLAIRFDFRGVGRSEGDVEDAAGHLEDVRRVAQVVREAAPQGPLLGAGFSYGARKLTRLIDPSSEDRPPIEGLLLLAPATRVPKTPRDFGNLLLGRPLDEAARDADAFRALARLPVPVELLVGDRDVVAPVPELRAVLPLHAHLVVLGGLNHFFSRGRGASETDEATLIPALDRAWRALLNVPSP